jgi:L-asparaginase II
MSDILVKEYRGDVVENVHYGSIAIVASTGETIAYIGDTEKQTYMRSASKPIQVLPTLLAKLHKRFNLTNEEVAMFNSSHWGSLHHKYVLESIMAKTELTEEDMIMNPTISTSATPLADKLEQGSKLNPVEGKSKLQHCCSGKHLSLMLLQRELTGKVDGYHLPDSPVQKQIISFISMLSQTPTYKISLGTDGCGVPVFALPMRNIALAYAKLADPFNLPEDVKEAITYDFECINQHPEKINDYYTPSYYVNKNPDLLMKDGSRGVICMSIRSRKLGIVVKLEDGWSDEFQGIIIANILEQLKYEDTELIEKLKTVYNTKLYNDCQNEIGYAESDFKLNIDPSYFEELYGTDEEASDSEADEDSDKNSDDSSDNDNDTDEADNEPDPEEMARMRALRNKHSILGQNVVLPSTGHGGYIQNPMTEPMRSVKSAKVISTVASTEDDIHELTEE